jgi:hypothetical protein
MIDNSGLLLKFINSLVRVQHFKSAFFQRLYDVAFDINYIFQAH